MPSSQLQSQSPVEIADQVSRRRAFVVAIAAIVFLGVQLIGRPHFVDGGAIVSRTRMLTWAVNAGLLLLVLATGGGLLNSRQTRQLVNDEVAQENRKRAIIFGFWMAMTLAMAIYVLPALAGISSRDAVYLIVTPTVGFTMLDFAWLEYRAHHGA